MAVLGLIFVVGLGALLRHQEKEASVESIERELVPERRGPTPIESMQVVSVQQELVPGAELNFVEKGLVGSRAFERENHACSQRILRALREPALPGAPLLEKSRKWIFMRSRGEPVLFLREPHFENEVSSSMATYQGLLRDGRYPRGTAVKLIQRYRGYPRLLRQAFLREGYFYTEDSAAAMAMTRLLKVRDFFDEPRVSLMRGSTVHRLKQSKSGRYLFETGPWKGRVATLFLFDRLWSGWGNLSKSLHVDLLELTRREGVERLDVEYLTERQIVARLRFAGFWALALLERDGAQLRLDCVEVPEHERRHLELARDEAKRRALVLEALRSSIHGQVDEQLPFDEPRTEVGQQDGELRAHFMDAYLRGKKKYEFNEDEYRVYDARGRPLVPQVCVDFVTETLERASGMHYRRRGLPPARVLGAINFSDLLGDRRRSEGGLRSLAKKNSDVWRLRNFPERKWEKYEDIHRFFRFILDHREDFQEGDIVFIRGRAAWDDYEELHTHTFFIYQNDPITGVPSLLVGNSGRPRILTWDREMERAPRRSIRHRIRMNTEWLYERFLLSEKQVGEDKAE
ncbi:MAG: hypothetical protein MK135_16275 [Polyangiaceae bacterium]|nr:hypothetical protein [Polyangiaceae bacterium]